MSSPTVTNDAYRRLHAELLHGHVAPGEKLKIDVLCRQLAVGSSAVREALSRLTSEGLVVAEPQRGFRVAPLSIDELRDLTEARCQIEGLCIRGAVEQGGIEWEASVVAALHSLSRTPVWADRVVRRYSDDYATKHAAFHEAIARGCNSVWLLRMRQMLFVQHERYRWLSGPLATVERDLDAEHRSIADAFIARDADRAVALMRDHLHQTAKILLDASVV